MLAPTEAPSETNPPPPRVHVGINMSQERNPFVVDSDPIRHRIIAEEGKLRPAIVSKLREFNADHALFDKLHNVIETREARTKIVGRGYDLARERHEAAFECINSTPDARESVIRDLRRQAWRRVEAACQEHNNRTARATIAEIQADIDRLRPFAALHEKYAVPVPRQLHDGLQRAIDRLEDASSRPFDVSWHDHLPTVLSQIFGIDLNTELAPAATAPAPASASAPEVVLAAKTAADVANARAAA